MLALLIITRGGWKLVTTVTAFTVSHSLTLSAATLGFVHVPQRPVEAVIALSIVFVAAEIIRMRRGVEGIAAQAPWIVALIFGLMHGLGFAGGLSEAGLPQGHVPTALLFFSLGVETRPFPVYRRRAVARRARASRPPALPRWIELVTPSRSQRGDVLGDSARYHVLTGIRFTQGAVASATRSPVWTPGGHAEHPAHPAGFADIDRQRRPPAAPTIPRYIVARYRPRLF